MDVAAPGNLVVNHWAVAFLDLLGQRDALRKMDFVPDARDEAKVAELIEAVRESVMVIQRFHGLYKAFRAGANGEDMGLLDHLPPEVQQRAKELRSTEVRSIRYSDGLVVWSSIVRSPKHSPVRALDSRVKPFRAKDHFSMLVAVRHLCARACSAARGIRLHAAVQKKRSMPGEH